MAKGREKNGRFAKGNQLSVGNHGGAPTTYKPGYCDQIIEYFTRPPQRTDYKRTFYADGTLKSEEAIILPEQLPTFQGFAAEIGTTTKTLNDWVSAHPEFCDAYTRAKELQEKIWLVNGMSGLYNSQFAQFFGKNCLGYKDKTEVEVSSKVITVDLLED